MITSQKTKFFYKEIFSTKFLITLIRKQFAAVRWKTIIDFRKRLQQVILHREKGVDISNKQDNQKQQKRAGQPG